MALVRPVVLDTGALIGLERRDPGLVFLTSELQRNHGVAYVPAGVVAQAWRASPRQHAVAKLLKSRAVTIEPLSSDTAFRIGALLARTGTSDVVDAHVALLARRLRATVVTSDPDDLAAIDPTLPLVVV